MNIQRFEDLIAWQLGRTLTGRVYQYFRDCRDFGFRDQIQRAAVSVMNNFAEGFEKNGSKEFIRYVFISKASCAEVRSMMYLAQDLRYVSPDDSARIMNLTDEIARVSRGLASSLSRPRYSQLNTRP